MKRQLPIIFMVLLLATAGCEPTNQVKWEPFSEAKLTEAAQLGKPAIAYFYAAWCAACYELKIKTFSDSQVITALEPYVRLKGDLSFIRSEESMKISRHYKVRGVPTVVLFDAKGEAVKRFSGFLPPQEFLNLLQPTPAPNA